MKSQPRKKNTENKNKNKNDIKTGRISNARQEVNFLDVFMQEHDRVWKTFDTMADDIATLREGIDKLLEATTILAKKLREHTDDKNTAGIGFNTSYKNTVGFNKPPEEMDVIPAPLEETDRIEDKEDVAEAIPSPNLPPEVDHVSVTPEEEMVAERQIQRKELEQKKAVRKKKNTTLSKNISTKWENEQATSE